MTSTDSITTSTVGTAPTPTRPGFQQFATPAILALAGLLAAQLLLALTMGWTGRDLGDTTAGTPLLPFGAEQVSRLEIAAPGQDPVALERRDDAWVLPELDGFPAAADKIEALLTKLAELERRLPVGASERALDRFKVADEAHERKLVARTTDGETAELLFGDSPGFRRIFVRPAGDTAVYEVPLAVSDITVRHDDWIDKSVLQLTADEIQRIRFPDLELVRGADGWQLQDANAGESLDTDKVDQLVRTLSSLSFTALKPAPGETADSEPAPESESVVDFQLTLDGDTQLDYRIVKTADGEHLLMLSSRPDRFFVISQYQAEQLLEQDRPGLLTTPPEPDAPPESEQSAGPANRD